MAIHIQRREFITLLGGSAQKIAARSERPESAWSMGCSNVDVSRNDSPLAERDHSAVDIIAKRAVEYVPPNETSDTRLPAITTGKRTVRSPRLGADADDGRQIQGAFRFAHFRAAKGFTPGADDRASAQRPSQSH
jgi:hypothetical protein